MLNIGRVIIIGAILLSFSGFSANLDKGQKLFSKCASCHGSDGMGKAGQKAPMLAGQYAWYITSQVTAIQSGERSNANTKKMVPFVKNLSPEEIGDLAAYIQSLPKRK